MDLNRIYNVDVLEGLAMLPDKSVHCCVTSPPYWGLRDYRMKGQLGLEKTSDAYIAKMVEVFRLVREKLVDDGTLWLNIADSYAHNGAAYGSEKSTLTGRKQGNEMGEAKRFVKKGGGLKPKDLVGIPWMLAFALRADGWYLRQDIIWSKPNPMPESVTDRCTKSHEYIFLLSKSKKYFFDQDAIREPLKDQSIARLAQNISGQSGSARVPGKTNGNMKAVVKGHRIGGATKYPGSGEEIHRTKSGKDWAPHMSGSGSGKRGIAGSNHSGYFGMATANKKSVWTVSTKPFTEAHFATFPEEIPDTCILAGSPVDGVVLDPFMGAGTTALVAAKRNRNFIGFELNPEYVKIAERRLTQELGMFSPLKIEVPQNA